MQPSAQWIVDDLWAAREAQTLITGTELGVFTLIANGHTTADGVAAQLGAPVRGVRRLLDALVGIGYLTKDGGRYGLEPLSERYLVQGGEGYVGDMVYEMKLLWTSWGRLAEVIRSGEPVQPWDEEETGRRLFPQLVAALFPMSLNSAKAAVAALPDTRDTPIVSVLDVAAGSAVWSIPFAQADPRVRVTAVDYAEITPITRRYTARHGVAGQYTHVEGNLREVELGDGVHDLAILGYIVQTEGPKWGQRLIERCFHALRPGGQLLIADMIPNDARTGPSAPLVYALEMVLHTTEGDVFTFAEYRQWLTEAGFGRVERIDIPAPWPLVLATKPAAL
ncbi:methyltransferase [Nonomuraea sediminis]|uniref:methyltransferase n=1 Tax=Nonomuraea sediminis TaxID=2835864 RepID=UPI001BDD9C9F|nr:methyltransferase [Nonomuraea sediminis]